MLGPVVVHDSRETSELGSVGAPPGTFAAAPVVYERRVGECDDRESAMLIGGAAILALGVAAVRRRRSSRDAEHPEP